MTATMIREEAGPTGGRADAKAAAKKDVKKKNFLKSKKGIAVIVAVLLVGGGAYKFLMPKKVGPPVGGDVVALDPNTLNLTAGHYLKIAVAVQLVQGKASATDFQTAKAAAAVLDEFSNRSVASLSSNAERNRLMTDLERRLKQAYPGQVFALFPTEFVTQ